MLASIAPCQEPVAPAHGWKRDRDFRHGRAVRFYCFGGYQRVGAASITCNDGKWNNRVPVCKGENNFLQFLYNHRSVINSLIS